MDVIVTLNGRQHTETVKCSDTTSHPPGETMRWAENSNVIVGKISSVSMKMAKKPSFNRISNNGFQTIPFQVHPSTMRKEQVARYRSIILMMADTVIHDRPC